MDVKQVYTNSWWFQHLVKTNMNPTFDITDAGDVYTLNGNKSSCEEMYQTAKKSLYAEFYAEWREVSEGMLADGMGGSIDFGESAARKDFSEFLGADKPITYEEMLELEKEYVKRA